LVKPCMEPRMKTRRKIPNVRSSVVYINVFA
jgi:hypothetical protein